MGSPIWKLTLFTPEYYYSQGGGSFYDENGNIIGPQRSGTNSNGTGTGGSGTGTGSGGTGSTGGTGGNTTTPTSNTVQFPVEVLGADQHTEQFKLVLNDDVSKLHGLKLKVHGLNYTNKMSISVNDSPWIALNNTNVDFPSKWDRAMYGMIKNHNTLTFVVPFAPNNIAKTITNNIKVKFTDIDKETIGYRILDADLVINTSPKGVADLLQVGNGVLFESLYDPWPTVLADKWKGLVIDGLDLLVHQAIDQIHLMTGFVIDRKLMYQVPRTAGEAQIKDRL